MSVTAGPLEMALSSVTWLRVWPPHYRIHFLQTKISFQFQLFFAHMWVHMVVFVCPNEPPCVYLCTTVRHKRMCIHFVCMCMYAHTFSAISFFSMTQCSLVQTRGIENRKEGWTKISNIPSSLSLSFSGSETQPYYPKCNNKYSNDPELVIFPSNHTEREQSRKNEGQNKRGRVNAQTMPVESKNKENCMLHQ